MALALPASALPLSLPLPSPLLLAPLEPLPGLPFLSPLPPLSPFGLTCCPLPPLQSPWVLAQSMELRVTQTACRRQYRHHASKGS